MLLTVTHAVLAAAVVTGELALFALFRRLRAVLGRVSELLAVVALHLATLDSVSSIIQASEDLLITLGPALTLARAGRLLGKTHGDGVRLTNVALEVHVREGARKGTLKSDKPKADVRVNETLLDGPVSRLTVVRLHVLLDRILDVVHITLGSGLKKFVPSSLRGHVLNVVSVDLAGCVTISFDVACSYECQPCQSYVKAAKRGRTDLPGHMSCK